MGKRKEIVLDGIEYVLTPKRSKGDIRNTLPKGVEPLYGLWKIFEEYKIKKDGKTRTIKKRNVRC